MSQRTRTRPASEVRVLPRTPTGIAGLDEITLGGLPRNRTTLVTGGPGCGKSTLGLEFLCEGIEQYGENGVLVSLEQPRGHVIDDARSVGWELDRYESQGRLTITTIRLSSEDMTETGPFTLDGFLLLLERAVAKVSARRLVIDSLDSFFAAVKDAHILREEFVRMAERLAQLGVTTLCTAASSAGSTGHRLEEYLSDCVILLDHRVIEQVSTRRLRVMKFRGTRHGTDEYPFVITDAGVRVFPVTSTRLDYPASNDQISSGVPDLDAMLAGAGFFRGSATLVAGEAGSGKTSLAAHFAAAVCAHEGKCVYFAFEESPQQLYRNLRSIGLDFARHVDQGRLKLEAMRPSLQGLEQHLVNMHDMVSAHGADAVVIDPITNLIAVGTTGQVKAMLTRLLDGFKLNQISVLMTSLIATGDDTLGADIAISSLMDTILAIESRVENHHLEQFLCIRKSRGIAHSRERRRLLFSSAGIRLVGVGRDNRETGRS